MTNGLDPNQAQHFARKELVMIVFHSPSKEEVFKNMSCGYSLEVTQQFFFIEKYQKYLNPYSAKKKMHLKMSSAELVLGPHCLP